MLIEILNGVGDIGGKAHHGGNFGATVATGFNQFAGNLATIFHDVDDGAKLLGHRTLHAGVRQHKAQGLR